MNSTYAHLLVGLFLACLTQAIVCRAQVIEVMGGASTLFQTNGGGFTVRGNDYEGWLGAGMVADRFRAGAFGRKQFGDYLIGAGDNMIRFNLPTDVFDNNPYFTGRGASIQTTRNGFNILAFGGVTSTDYNAPFFHGAVSETPAGVVFVRKRLSPSVDYGINTIFSDRITAIPSISWRPKDDLRFGVSAGVGSGQAYGATSFAMRREWVEVKASYIQSGENFRRVIVHVPLIAEPAKENVLVTLFPNARVSFTAARLNYLVPEFNSTRSTRSSVNQFGTRASFAGVTLGGTVYESRFENNRNKAYALFASRNITSRARISTNYFASKPSSGMSNSSWFSTITGFITPRISVSQSVNYSRGRASLSYGGSFLSNLFSFNAEYQTFYVPLREGPPFQQALIASVNFRFFGLNIHGQSFMAPDGRVRYTADASKVLYYGASASPVVNATGSIGKYIIRGKVVNAHGLPVPGAVLLIDARAVITDSSGEFFVRESRVRTHSLQVLTDQFQQPGRYSVVTAPTRVQSSKEEEAIDVMVVVDQF